MSIPGAEKKLACALCGILIGWTGAHRFVMGDTSGGLIRLALTLACGISYIIGVVEGIIYLTKSDQQFVDEYIIGKKAWF
jgi:TM2 domain-containing membrane protein YozV